jgi:hypothetical protein
LNDWESKDRSDRRIFVTTNGFLHAIDALTGKSIGLPSTRLLSQSVWRQATNPFSFSASVEPCAVTSQPRR